MSSNSQPRREVNALRERIAALSLAILRVNASLDVDTVLHEIAGSAGARYAVIVTIDEDRRRGPRPEERRHLRLDAGRDAADRGVDRRPAGL